MDRDRIEEFGAEVWRHCWLMLDADPEVNAVDAGRVSHCVKAAFMKTMEAIYGNSDSNSSKMG